MRRSTLISLTVFMLLVSCSGSRSLMNPKDGSYDYYQLKDALSGYLKKPAVLHVGDVQIQCVVSDLQSDRLIIEQAGRVQEIPVRAISRIELGELGRSLMYTGMTSAIGALAGWIAGKGLSSEVLSKEWKKFKQNDKQIAAAAAGASIGFLAGAFFGNRKGRNTLVINPQVESLTLDRSVGNVIPGRAIQDFGVFDDLPVQTTETIASIKIAQYGPTDYLILYDSFERPELPKYAYDGRAMTIKIPPAQMKLHWMPVNRDYLVKQQDKIHKNLKKQDEQLKNKLFEQ
ncbi:hypothetical protein K1X84_12150 [bacterium]|nr:hypothetical protein [bacterium]